MAAWPRPWSLRCLRLQPPLPTALGSPTRGTSPPVAPMCACCTLAAPPLQGCSPSFLRRTLLTWGVLWRRGAPCWPPSPLPLRPAATRIRWCRRPPPPQCAALAALGPMPLPPPLTWLAPLPACQLPPCPLSAANPSSTPSPACPSLVPARRAALLCRAAGLPSWQCGQCQVLRRPRRPLPPPCQAWLPLSWFGSMTQRAAPAPTLP